MQMLSMLSLLLLPLLGLIATRKSPHAAWLPKLLRIGRLLSLLVLGVLVATENVSLQLAGFALDPLSLLFLLPIVWESISQDFGEKSAPNIGREGSYVLLCVLCLTDSLLGLWACLTLLVWLGQRGLERERLLREAFCLSLCFLGVLGLAWAGSKLSLENAWSLSALSAKAGTLDRSLCTGASIALNLGLLGLLGFWPSSGERGLLPRVALLYALVRFLGLTSLAIGPEKTFLLPQMLSLVTLLQLWLHPEGKHSFSLARYQDATLLFAMSITTRSTMQASLLLFLVWFAAYPRPAESKSMGALGAAASLGAPPLAGTLPLLSLLGSVTVSVSDGSLWSSLSSWKILFLLLVLWFHLQYQLTRLTALSWEKPRRSEYIWLVLLVVFGMYLPESVDSLLNQAARLALGR